MQHQDQHDKKFGEQLGQRQKQDKQSDCHDHHQQQQHHKLLGKVNYQQQVPCMGRLTPRTVEPKQHSAGM